MLTTEENENKAELTEIPASEILDKIQKSEPVEYDQVKIIGDLDLSKINLPTENVARPGRWYNIQGVPPSARFYRRR